ncbi:MAG: pyridoxamine 5'-phosphate oxidase family protein [Myxococcota bacterium]|nr:pyridoxamine 5'-phosphate oxidase family protein [Myxococcota bacterium]
MNDFATTAQAFVEMAHRIVWCSAATVDAKGRPRSRVLHPIWRFSGERLEGFIGTGPTKVKRAHLEASPFVSLNYWDPSQDTCVAECAASWAFDDETCTEIWNAYKEAPPPVGYDPAMIPVWEQPTDESFAVLRLEPWRLRVFPGSVLMGQGGDVLTWQAR